MHSNEFHAAQELHTLLSSSQPPFSGIHDESLNTMDARKTMQEKCTMQAKKCMYEISKRQNKP